MRYKRLNKTDSIIQNNVKLNFNEPRAYHCWNNENSTAAEDWTWNFLLKKPSALKQVNVVSKCQYYRRHTNPWHLEEERQTMNQQHQFNRLNIQLVRPNKQNLGVSDKSMKVFGQGLHSIRGLILRSAIKEETIAKSVIWFTTRHVYCHIISISNCILL